MNIPMSLRDISLWEEGSLRGFILPYTFPLPEVGDVVNILEPFRKIYSIQEGNFERPTSAKRATVGVEYLIDGSMAWIEEPFSKYEVSHRRSDASALPEYAVRRRAAVVKIESKPTSKLGESDARLLHLDYESTNDPQILMSEMLDDFNFDSLNQWWKAHYRFGIDHRGSVVVLHLRPSN